MPFENHERLLALSYKPQDGNSIIDWCPFGNGVTLNNIINDYNEGCFQSYSQLWGEGYARMLTGIDIDISDLSTVNTLKVEDFKEIRFLLIDLDVIKGKSEMESLARVRRSLDYLRKRCFLLQVSTTPDAKPLPSEFRPTFSMPFGPPLYPEIPEIIHNLETFKKALFSYCRFIGMTVNQRVTILPE